MSDEQPSKRDGIALPETFRCTQLACTLTRSSCGARHTRAANGGRAAGARIQDERLMAGDCATCAIGAAHARGERPDVSITSLTARRQEDEMAEAKQHEYRGEKYTRRQLAELPEARLLDISADLVRKRLENGWSAEDAINIPVGTSRPSRPRSGRPRIADPSVETQQRREQRERRQAQQAPARMSAKLVEFEGDVPTEEVAGVLGDALTAIGAPTGEEARKQDHALFSEDVKRHVAKLKAKLREGYEELLAEGEAHVEKVDHPAHYGGAENVYETIKVLEAWLTPEQFAGFCLGNALKYQSRAGKKNGESRETDLKKGKWYMDHYLARAGARS